MASLVETNRYGLLPLPLTSSLRACPCRFSSPNTVLLSPKRCRKRNLGVVLNGSESVLRVRRTEFSLNRRFVAAVARAEPDRFNENNAKEVILQLSCNFEILALCYVMIMIRGCRSMKLRSFIVLCLFVSLE